MYNYYMDEANAEFKLIEDIKMSKYLKDLVKRFGSKYDVVAINELRSAKGSHTLCEFVCADGFKYVQPVAHARDLASMEYVFRNVRRARG